MPFTEYRKSSLSACRSRPKRSCELSLVGRAVVELAAGAASGESHVRNGRGFCVELDALEPLPGALLVLQLTLDLPVGGVHPEPEHNAGAVGIEGQSPSIARRTGFPCSWAGVGPGPRRKFGCRSRYWLELRSLAEDDRDQEQNPHQPGRVPSTPLCSPASWTRLFRVLPYPMRGIPVGTAEAWSGRTLKVLPGKESDTMALTPPATNPSPVGRIAFIGGHLPRRCGIATFTTDVCRCVATAYPDTACLAVAVNDRAGGYNYPDPVRFTLEEQDLESYRGPPDFLNISAVDVVCLQHEFGIFGGPAGSHILALLRELKMRW